MTTYKSKVGLALLIPILVIVGGTGSLMAFEKVWPGVVIILLAAAFIGHIFITTYYQVYNNTLKIRSGILFNKSIDICTIRKIKETNNPISSPATSLDRIEITYNKFDTVIISPKDKEVFINHLRSINPGIKLILKKSSKQIAKTV